MRKLTLCALWIFLSSVKGNAQSGDPVLIPAAPVEKVVEMIQQAYQLPEAKEAAVHQLNRDVVKRGIRTLLDVLKTETELSLFKKQLTTLINPASVARDAERTIEVAPVTSLVLVLELGHRLSDSPQHAVAKNSATLESKTLAAISELVREDGGLETDSTHRAFDAMFLASDRLTKSLYVAREKELSDAAKEMFVEIEKLRALF